MRDREDFSPPKSEEGEVRKRTCACAPLHKLFIAYSSEENSGKAKGGEKRVEKRDFNLLFKHVPPNGRSSWNFGEGPFLIEKTARRR